MTWNFVRISASLSALCTNFDSRNLNLIRDRHSPQEAIKVFARYGLVFMLKKNYLFVGKIFEHI